MVISVLWKFLVFTPFATFSQSQFVIVMGVLARVTTGFFSFYCSAFLSLGPADNFSNLTQTQTSDFSFMDREF